MKKIQTDKAPAAIGPYSQAMVSGNLVYTSGQIPLSPDTGEVVGTKVDVQTETVIDNLKAVLLAANSSIDRVI
jgi:2-iminobutanoate/2-iminopropanoate deaminase